MTDLDLFEQRHQQTGTLSILSATIDTLSTRLPDGVSVKTVTLEWFLGHAWDQRLDQVLVQLWQDTFTGPTNSNRGVLDLSIVQILDRSTVPSRQVSEKRRLLEHSPTPVRIAPVAASLSKGLPLFLKIEASYDGTSNQAFWSDVDRLLVTVYLQPRK